MTNTQKKQIDLGGIDFLLFDADGTLFDFDRSERCAFGAIAERFGFDGSGDVYEVYHEINAELWKDFERGLIEKGALLVERFRRLSEKYEFNADPAAVNREYLWELGGYGFLLDGAYEVCEKLVKDYRKKLCIVTNGTTQVQKRRFASSELSKLLSGVFVSEEIGFPKPDIRYFEHVFSHIKDFDISRALVIGDSLSSDIRGANTAGVASCWYNPKQKENNEGVVCDYTISSLWELVPETESSDKCKSPSVFV